MGLCLLAGMGLAAVNVTNTAASDACAKCRAEHNRCRTTQASLDSSKCDAQLVRCLRTCKKN